MSNSGFGHSGPYKSFRTWGPIVQGNFRAYVYIRLARPSGGRLGLLWYMDHQGDKIPMALAILGALIRRTRFAEGTWIDLSTVEAGVALLGPCVLDWSINDRGMRREGMPDSNHNQHPRMVPHNIYPAAGTDEWVAIACRDDVDWGLLIAEIGEEWTNNRKWETPPGTRARRRRTIDQCISAWTRRAGQNWKFKEKLQGNGIPAAAVQRPKERIDQDEIRRSWGLWREP